MLHPIVWRGNIFPSSIWYSEKLQTYRSSVQIVQSTLICCIQIHQLTFCHICSPSTFACTSAIVYVYVFVFPKTGSSSQITKITKIVHLFRYISPKKKVHSKVFYNIFYHTLICFGFRCCSLSSPGCPEIYKRLPNAGIKDESPVAWHTHKI